MIVATSSMAPSRKDDRIEAVLYRQTWEVELQGGEKQTHTRHNLTKILKVDRINFVKGQNF